MKKLLNNWTKSWWWIAYRKMPLWGQIATPAVALFVAVALFKLFGWVFKIGFLALIVFGVIWFYRKMSATSDRK